MKRKQPLLLLTGALILGLSFQALAQDPSNGDKAQLLQKKKQEIERLVKENKELKQQISEHESNIADFKSQIKSLDKQIQDRKQQQKAAAKKDNT